MAKTKQAAKIAAIKKALKKQDQRITDMIKADVKRFKRNSDIIFKKNMQLCHRSITRSYNEIRKTACIESMIDSLDESGKSKTKRRHAEPHDSELDGDASGLYPLYHHDSDDGLGWSCSSDSSAEDEVWSHSDQSADEQSDSGSSSSSGGSVECFDSLDNVRDYLAQSMMTKAAKKRFESSSAVKTCLTNHLVLECYGDHDLKDNASCIGWALYAGESGVCLQYWSYKCPSQSNAAAWGDAAKDGLTWIREHYEKGLMSVTVRTGNASLNLWMKKTERHLSKLARTQKARLIKAANKLGCAVKWEYLKPENRKCVEFLAGLAYRPELTCITERNVNKPITVEMLEEKYGKNPK